MKIMRKAIKASTTNSDPRAIVDEIIMKAEELVKYGQDINEAINRNGGSVYDIEELRYDADNILDDLGDSMSAMSKMAQWQRLF